jgi:hypothetical protein
MPSTSDQASGDDPVDFLCPSGRCQPGSKLLGIISIDGEVGYVQPALDLTSAFCESANLGRDPRTRFRFAEQCAECDCAQWDDQRCQVITRVLSMDAAAPLVSDASAKLPRCGIRHRCRWFAQEGRNACAVCPRVVTEGAEA